MTSTKRLEFRFERTIPAPASEVFDAWLDPRVPGNPWNAAERFIVDAKADGLFYWTLRDVPLRPIYRIRAAESPAAYLGVAEHPGRRVDGDGDLHDAGHADGHDARALRPAES